MTRHAVRPASLGGAAFAFVLAPVLALVLALVLGVGPALAAAPGDGAPGRPWWMTALIGFGFALLFLAIAWLPSALTLAWRRLRALPTPWLAGLGGVVLAGAVLRLFVVPHQVVTAYMGYQLTSFTAELEAIPRYGVGAQVLWRALFQVAPTDHAAVIALHAVLGTLTLLWLAAALLRAGLRPAGVVAATALAAFLPQFLWADASDSLTVPVLFWTLGAVVFAQEYLATRQWSPLVGAVAWLALAAHTRPEHVVFGPLLVLVFLAAGGTAPRLRERLRAPLAGWLVALGGYALLALPQVLYALHMRGVMTARGGWPHTFAEILPRVPGLFVKANALFDPEMVPLALAPLAVLGLVTAPSWAARRLRLALLGLGVVWLCFYYIDLSVASLPRLHVVLALPAAIAAGGLLGDLWQLRPLRARWLGPALGALGVGAVVAGVPTAAQALFHPTNEGAEDAFFREAAAALPASTPFVFVRLGRGDKAQGDMTHHHHPDYLVRPPARPGHVLSVSELLAEPRLPDRPVYWYKGMRCYSRLRREDEPPPARYLAPACERMEEAFTLEPVVERVVENQGDRMLPYYSTEPRFGLGLYRVTARRPGSEPLAALGLPPAPSDEPPSAPALPQTQVVPPGQEALVTRMLGEGRDIAGCRFDSAALERTHVRATYACADGATATVELHAPAAPVAATERTAQFAIVVGAGAPAELAAALAANVRAHEAGWRWAVGAAPDAVAAQPPPPAPEGPPVRDVSPAFREKYALAHRLYREQRHAEAVAVCADMARERPDWGGVLGMLVANLAPTQPDAARVAELIAAADAAPDDVLSQFMAGVGAHYSAHYKARTVEEKKALYRTALTYLERTRPHFDFEPRVYIYLAVSHFRLGHQAEAERYIAQAIALGRQDPDAYYCRAEIYQHKDPQSALKDLDTYVQMTTGPEYITQGDKPQRVQKLKEKIQARIRGEAAGEELFDPIEPE